MSNTITAFFNGRVGVCESLYQYDFGIVLVLDGVMFDTVFDAYFSTTGEDDAIPVIGKYNRVAIPDSCLEKPGVVTVHIPIHEGQNDSEVEYIITFRVIGRARPIYDGTPEESTAIAKALAVLQDIQGDVSAWLDDHPEATTTVQDGSLTEAKFTDALKLKTIKDYITPEMFGAKGDGIVDDLSSLTDAIEYSIDNEIPLYLGKKYYISAPIDLSAKGNVSLNIFGSAQARKRVPYPYEDNVGNSSVIHCPEGLFVDSKLFGNIQGIIVYSARDEMPSLFKDCELHFSLSQVMMLNFTKVFDSCTSNSVRLKGLFCLTVRNFLYNCTFVDSNLSDSYINGGDNNSTGVFARLTDGNGSNITNNFIDYYRVMYQDATDAGNQLAIVSTGNQYQVFRYFETLAKGTFASLNDTFAYCNEAASTAHGYAADSVTNVITKESVTVSPCVAYCVGLGKKSFINANMMRTYDNILFVHDFAMYEYKNAHAEFDFVLRGYTEPTEQILSSYIGTGNAGTGNLYRPDVYKSNLIRVVSSVADTYTGANQSIPVVFGEIVSYNNNLYKVVPYFYDSGSGIRPGGYKFEQLTVVA